MTPNLGGSSLASVTDSSAQQRLLIAYDPDDPESFGRLVRDLQEVIDVPAQQILIEGMIVEVSQDKLRELGFDYSVTDRRMTYSLTEHGETSTRPFTVEYNDFVVAPEGFTAKLRLLVEEGFADILSKP